MKSLNSFGMVCRFSIVIVDDVAAVSVSLMLKSPIFAERMNWY